MILPEIQPKLDGHWLRAKDLKNGDVIMFMDSGIERESKYKYADDHPTRAGQLKKEYIFKISFKGADYLMRVNWTSIRECQGAWGNDTSAWKGKQCSVGLTNTPDGKNKVVNLSPDNEVQWDG